MSLLRAGIDLSTIALWLGHEQIATVQIYLVSQKLHQTGEGTADLRQLAA
jgi:integrase/recombinase XerD